MPASADDILRFWFEENRDGSYRPEQAAFWFQGGEEVDRLIRKRFEVDLLAAVRGDLDSWEGTPRGRLALIILLDQFSRNIYRDTPQEVAQDVKALGLCLRGLVKGDDLLLTPIERVFFYLPMEHSEDFEMQRNSVTAFKGLLESLSPDLIPKFQIFLDYAVAHLRIIERFGRFPYQNEILGRESTLEEIEFLKLPGAPFFLD